MLSLKPLCCLSAGPRIGEQWIHCRISWGTASTGVSCTTTAPLPQVKPQGSLHRSWKFLTSWRKGTLHGAWILTLMGETAFHCSLPQKESGFITARIIPVLSSKPWSRLLLGMCSPNTTFITGGLEGFWVLVGFFLLLMLLKTKGGIHCFLHSLR